MERDPQVLAMLEAIDGNRLVNAQRFGEILGSRAMENQPPLPSGYVKIAIENGHL